MIKKFLTRTEFESYEDFKKNYRIEIPDCFNFGFDVVDARAELEPEKKALVWCDDHCGEKELTFLEVKTLSNRIANMLRAAGIKKGDVVLLILKQRYEYWLFATALHKIGAVLIPGSVQLTKKDVVYRANAAKIKMIICVDDAIPQIEEAAPECPSIASKMLLETKRVGWLTLAGEINKHSDKFERDASLSSRDVMLIYFTSGTTGQPKMVAHDHTYPLGHITTAAYWQRAGEDSLHMTDSDSGWAKFGWGKIYGQWIAGAAVFAYNYDRFDPIKMLRVMEKYKITSFCASPTVYRFFIKEDLTQFDLSHIRHAATAGEPLNPEVFNRFYDATGLKLYEGFGQSESSVLLANFEWFEPVPGSMGKISPLYEIDLLDENGKSCGDGEEGEIVIKNLNTFHPPGLLKGYYENGKIITDCFKDGMYYTGDVAWRDFNGHYWFVGRRDDMIKCSGYRIGPFEVESAVLEHPSVLECAVTGAPDPIRGQVVKATVVLARGFAPSDELAKEIQDHVKKTTAPYKYPRRIEFVAELPKTLGGKIKRGMIRNNDAE